MMAQPEWHNFDVHLVHLYTLGNWNNDIDWLDHCQHQTPNMPIWITESSWHTDDAVAGKVYAEKLVQLVELLDRRSVRGIAFYCVSARNPGYYHEVWCRGSDKTKPHENIVSRGIAQGIRQLRPVSVPAAV